MSSSVLDNPSFIFKKAPDVLQFVCVKSGSFLTNGGDFKEVCDKVVGAVKRNPYAAPISLGSLMMTGSYFGLRRLFAHTPAVKSVETARKEIEHLLDRVEKLVELNDQRIETYASIKVLRSEIGSESTSSRLEQVRSNLERMERDYRLICKKLGKEIHSALASIQLQVNLDRETKGVATLRKIESDGLKEHVRLGHDDNLTPSDYINAKVRLVEDTLIQLDTDFQEELNKIYQRPKEENPSNEDFFPERKIYQGLHKDLYGGLCEISRALNTLKSKELSVWQKVYGSPTIPFVSTVLGVSGFYLAASSYHISLSGGA